MKSLFLIFILFGCTMESYGQLKFQHDEFQTAAGPLTVYFIGHASLMFDLKGTIIDIDPWGRLADYSTFPKADIILITHQHQDHFDQNAIASLTKKETEFILTPEVFEILKKGTVMKNGDTLSIHGIGIEAVPAYNTTKGRDQFHPKGRDNGYILTIGKKRIYLAGDTENTPEMAALKNIDVAFLPMNQPYTMIPQQVADAAEKFHPKILYPYHYGETDVSALSKLLAKDTTIDVRIRPLK